MKALVIIVAVIALIAAFSAAVDPGPHARAPYFSSHGCHYIQRTDFMGNHIYKCPSHG